VDELKIILDADEVKCLARLLAGETLVPAERRELIHLTNMVEEFMEMYNG
jgi:hypothetical protein